MVSVIRYMVFVIIDIFYFYVEFLKLNGQSNVVTIDLFDN